MIGALGRALRDQRLGTARPPTVRWARGGLNRRGATRMACPNCGAGGAKPALATVTVKILDHPAQGRDVLRCPACGCAFYAELKPPDYAAPALTALGRVPFYVQQGAGLWSLIAPLARLPAPPGASYLEVGCGYGFALDYAVHGRGWVGWGIDPSPLGAVGARALGVRIEPRYFSAEDARVPRDVVLSSETIEHVPSPPRFVRMLRWALRPGGVLVLTTPDAGALFAAAESGVPADGLVPLLSPGLHLVLQTRESLEVLLVRAGFRHVEVAAEAGALVAMASDAPIAAETRPEVLRGAYISHLEARAAAARDDDLVWGFAGRALFEAANASRFDVAARLWPRLRAAGARLGLDLDAPVLPDAARGASLEAMARLIPLNLPLILYARAMHLMLTGTARAAVEPGLRVAAAAAAEIRRALAAIAIDDLLLAEVGWTARAEAMLCAAERGAESTVAEARALPPAPGRAAMVARARAALAGAGAPALAARLDALAA